MNRREFLWQSGGGFGGMAWAALFGAQGLLAGPAVRPDGGLHHKPKAKRVVQMFMAGAASHIDLFDDKPELVKRHGQKSDFGEKVEAFQDGLGPWLKPVFEFKPYGSSGKRLGSPVAALGDVVDQIAFVHNMVGKTGIHSQATMLQSTGFQRPGFPSAGAWVSYGLGRISDNLPAFVVLPDHRGLPSNGTKNWDTAFLPAQHQGTVVYPGTKTPIEDLFPDERVRLGDRPGDIAGVELLGRLNGEHAQSRPGDDRLEARIRSYELAARMQLAAPEALDFSRESKETLRLYGIEDVPASFDRDINPTEEIVHFGRKCLTARRFLERGVRFVQIWSGNDNSFPRRNWDSHEDVKRDHEPLAIGFARGAAALIQDLKRLGMLDDTIILWTTEFGRMPSSQGGKGRDHNPYCFTNWLCGGGIKGGISYGPSDEFGYKPADRRKPTEVYDIHATILHLLGIDHEKLTLRKDGIDRRLTDVHGHVIHDLLA
jgi:hypothetical protein